jgi:hypothetical protein
MKEEHRYNILNFDKSIIYTKGMISSNEYLFVKTIDKNNVINI